MSEDFGSYLKHERELRGVPLDDIVQSTKISLRFLRALEENRFEDLPGEVFIKGFIRSYGQAIGSDVDEMLAVYHESGLQRKAAEAAEMVPDPSIRGESSERHSGFPMQAVVGFGAALLIIIGGIYWFNSRKVEHVAQPEQASAPTIDNRLPELEGEDPAIASEEASTPPAVTDNLNPEARPVEATEPPAVVIPDDAPNEANEAQKPVKNTVTVPEKNAIIEDIQNQDELLDPATEVALGDSSLNLVIQVNENSWFNLRIDDQRDQDFILPPGGSKTIQASYAIVMTIGNRRATQLYLNGQELDLPESPDNVVRNLTVNAEQLN